MIVITTMLLGLLARTARAEGDVQGTIKKLAAFQPCEAHDEVRKPKAASDEFTTDWPAPPGPAASRCVAAPSRP